VREPIELSDGTTLNKGTHFCVASSQWAMDPTVFPNPELFDGFRYHRMRNDPEEKNPNRHQFATTDKNHLHFGHGRFACPGRFFASLEMKVLLGHLILDYDFKHKNPDIPRPKTLVLEDTMMPNLFTELLFKKRQREALGDWDHVEL
jgi:cytochrome P450